MTAVLIVVVVVLAIAGALIYVGSRVPSQEEDPLLARMNEFTQRGEQISLEKLEMSQSIRDRVIYPLLKKFGDIATHFTPQNALQDVTRKLELSGKSGWIDAPMFLALRFVVAAVFAVVSFVLFTFTIVKQHYRLPFSIACLARRSVFTSRKCGWMEKLKNVRQQCKKPCQMPSTC